MRQYTDEIEIVIAGAGLHEITGEVEAVVKESGIDDGLVTVFLRHTSASLVIQENADPSARRDLENFLARLIPENDPLYTHTAEGPDDMPAHIRAALTHTSEQLPVRSGSLGLGTWQGLYLWEHRRGRGRRKVWIHVLGG